MHDKEFSRTEIIQRIFDVSRTAVVNKDVATAQKGMHEVQQLYIYLLAPFFHGIISLDDQIDIEQEETAFTFQDVLSTIVHRIQQSYSQGLSFSETIEAYDHIVGHSQTIEPGKYPLPNLQDKRTFLITLQALNLFITRQAILDLTMNLDASKNALEKQLSVEIFSLNEQPSRSDTRVRSQAMISTHGAGNDGITHLAAVIDALWDSPKHTDTEELFKETRRFLIDIMTKYPSWQVQLLDTMLIAERNPYVYVAETNTLSETKMCHEFQKYVSRAAEKATYSAQALLPILEKSLQILQIQGREKDAALTICQAAVAMVRDRTHTGLEDYFSFTKFLDVTENKKKFAACPDRKLRRDIERMHDKLFLRAGVIAQIPYKILAAISEMEVADPNHSPRCMLLNVPKGFPQWTQALYDSLMLIKQG